MGLWALFMFHDMFECQVPLDLRTDYKDITLTVTTCHAVVPKHTQSDLLLSRECLASGELHGCRYIPEEVADTMTKTVWSGTVPLRSILKLS